MPIFNQDGFAWRRRDPNSWFSNRISPDRSDCGNHGADGISETKASSPDNKTIVGLSCSSKS